MTNAHTDGEALIPLDRELFDPATASAGHDDGPTPVALAEPVVDGQGVSPITPDTAGRSPDGGPMIQLDRPFFTRATSETEVVGHEGPSGHEGHTPADHVDVDQTVWAHGNTRTEYGTSQSEPASATHEGGLQSATSDSASPAAGATTTPTDAGNADFVQTAPDGLLTERTVDGQDLLGSDTQDGGWISQDGTVYVSGDGTVEHGLTAPDGAFLADGEVLQVDGQSVYGTRLGDGSFLSADGSTLVSADGVVEHGQTTSDGQFLTERTVDGRTLWGSDTQDGGWLSQDGTVYVSSDGGVEHGLTAPAGAFLVNGEVQQVDGQTVYGTQLDDGSFLSEDGTTLVSADGVVEHGQTTSDGQFLTERTVDGRNLLGSDTQDGGWISEDGTVYVSADGEVEYGQTSSDGSFVADGDASSVDGSTTVADDGTTTTTTTVTDDGTATVTDDGTATVADDGTTTVAESEDPASDDSAALTSRTVGGQTLLGSTTQDGGWISQDGTVYVSPAGEVEYGLTAPDGSFLPNGQVRTVNGQQVYGSVLSDGTWVSADGTVEIRPDGTVLNGQTTADGQFLTSETVGGQTLLGSATQDGGWISQDGTVYVSAGGEVEHGISTPDGSFLKDGVTRTLPDGTVLYGYMSGGDFYSSDGTTVVLADGTVLTGTLDTQTGMFTASDGSYHLVTDNGIEGATQQSDGSFLLDNGQTVMTPAAWAVDIGQLGDAITLVRNRARVIEDNVNTIQSQYQVIEDAWKGPAGTSFSDVATEVNKTMRDLHDLLIDMIGRMMTSKENYISAENANISNSQGS
ncbi:WXG100 family type VII secretion target [Streptomyces sp. NPDC002574]|uniref:WXG100 family type VII secretion target n=1 Tax=Streptomyces sp. NPDC002574 TaxID=3364652 RepID=UPI00367A450C